MRWNVNFWACLLLCSFAVSCSWSKRWFAKKNDASNESLQRVGAKEEELQKFSVSEVAVPATVVEPEATKVVMLVPPKKKGVLPKPSASVPAPKKIIATAPAVSTVSASFVYPVDHPTELKLIDERASAAWSKFKPRLFLNEEMFLNVDYLGMTVGKVVLSYRGLKSMNGKSVHHFQAYLKSAPFYSAIYELDDHLDAYVDQEKFVSLRSNLVQRESKQDVDEVQLFDQEKLFTQAYQKQVRGDQTKNRKWKGPITRYNIDSLSVLWLIRGLPLANGDTYLLPIINKGRIVLMDVMVVGREKIKTKLGEHNCIKVKAHTKYSGKTLKSGDMTFWLSDDEKHSLIMAQAKIKIGSVYAEAVKPEE